MMIEKQLLINEVSFDSKFITILSRKALFESKICVREGGGIKGLQNIFFMP